MTQGLSRVKTIRLAITGGIRVAGGAWNPGLAHGITTNDQNQKIVNRNHTAEKEEQRSERW